MAFTIGNIISDVLAFWNRPSEAELSQTDIITIANRKINRMLLSMQLSDHNFLAALTTAFSFDDGERFKVLDAFEDISSIVRVESRGIGDTSDDSWSEEVITDYGSWNDTMLSRTDSVAFYGSSPDNLTMAVNRDASSLEFRILYETGGISLANFVDSVPVLQDLFRSTVFYGVAAEAGMMLNGLNAEGENSRDKKATYALAQEMQSIDDFKRWLLNDPGQAVEYRESFASRRQGTGRPRMFAINSDISGYYSRY